MGKILKKKSQQAGLPPGTLMHVVEERPDEFSVTIMDYDEYHFQEVTAKDFETCIPFRDKPTVTWIHVVGVHRVETMQSLGNCFQLHPLTLEDILITDQRTKIESYEDYAFIVLRNIYYEEAREEIATEQISLILGQNFVISFQEKEGGVFNPIAHRLRNNKARMRRMGADYLVYALLDVLVDNYFTVLEKFGDRIERLEERMVRADSPRIPHTLHSLRREMIMLRKAVWPLREIISGLGRTDSNLVTQSTSIYLRDVYDHTVQVIDTIEIFRDVLTGMLDVYLSSVSNRLNSVMKVLTIISTIFMPLTFLAGVYGMNFKHMPELEWEWGYPLTWAIMIAMAGVMLVYFRVRKWI